jgi:redox-sensitive bicupin YhaK (pirin superfamily)
VLIGDVGDVTSPARHDTPLLGVDLDIGAGAATVVPVRRDFEHALVVLDGAVTIGGTTLTPGHLGYLGTDRDEIPLLADERSRVLLLGGEPFEQPILMWWNFVARDRADCRRRTTPGNATPAASVRWRPRSHGSRRRRRTGRVRTARRRRRVQPAS